MDAQTEVFLLNTARDDVRHWLAGALAGLGTLVVEASSQEAVADQISALRPGLVFLDFIVVIIVCIHPLFGWCLIDVGLHCL